MEARETDFEYPQDEGIVASQVDGIAGGIMDMIDNTSPLDGGNVESKGEVEEEQTEAQAEEQTEETTPADEPEKYTIKWQGEEKEVTQDELIELAQKGFDYTKKTQDLSVERDNLAPYVGLANQIKARPELAQKIAELLTGTQQVQQPQIDDPVEQLKYEMRKEAEQIADQKIKTAIDPLSQLQRINAVKAEVQRDPDYKKVQEEMVNLIKSQPPVLQEQLAKRLNEDIPTYLETFQFLKKKLATEPVKPTPVKKETKAPLLEAGGVESPEMANNKAKTERLSKMKAKALRSGDPSEIASWLTDSGALDHLY
jgi:hypothetical protein